MKSLLNKSFVAIAGLIACFQWSQIAYRYGLFYYDYHGKRGLNHIGGGFEVAYFIDATFVIIGIFVLHSLRNAAGFRRSCTFAFVLANLAGGITLFNMHRTGVLVSYAEAFNNSRRYYIPEPKEDESAWLNYKQAEAVGSNYLSTNGYANLRLRAGWLDGRYPRFWFSTNSSIIEIKVVVDRLNGKVGNDYSH